MKKIKKGLHKKIVPTESIIKYFMIHCAALQHRSIVVIPQPGFTHANSRKINFSAQETQGLVRFIINHYRFLFMPGL